jgi:hypothetical protein
MKNGFVSTLAKAGLIVALAAAANACVVLAPGKGGDGATVCHKGKKTMTLPADAVAAHLDHGDRRGPC